MLFLRILFFVDVDGRYKAGRGHGSLLGIQALEQVVPTVSQCNDFRESVPAGNGHNSVPSYGIRDGGAEYGFRLLSQVDDNIAQINHKI